MCHLRWQPQPCSQDFSISLPPRALGGGERERETLGMRLMATPQDWEISLNFGPEGLPLKAADILNKNMMAPLLNLTVVS